MWLPSVCCAKDAEPPQHHLELLKCLLKPYWKGTEEGWGGILREANVASSDRRPPVARFDLGARDEQIRAVDRLLHAQPKGHETQILIIENIFGGAGRRATYTRHGLYFLPDASPAIDVKLHEMGMVSVNAAHWTTLAVPLRKLLQPGGQNPGVDYILDACDATVVSFFDGRRWKIETYFFLADARDAAYREVGTRDQLRPVTRAYLSLLENIVGVFEPLPPIGGPNACSLFDYFADQHKVPEEYRVYNGTAAMPSPGGSTTRPTDQK